MKSRLGLRNWPDKGGFLVMERISLIFVQIYYSPRAVRTAIDMFLGFPLNSISLVYLFQNGFFFGFLPYGDTRVVWLRRPVLSGL